MPEDEGRTARTSLHARRAREGDAESLAWLVERFGPALMAQARYRLGSAGTRPLEPEDLVGETWAVALPRLDGLEERRGRLTPVLLRFLSTTLLQLANNHVRRRLRRGPLAAQEAAPLDALSAQQRRIVSQVGEREEARALRAALDALPERDREVVVLRGIEQLSNDEAARAVGDSPNAVSLRYRRALERLRTLLPGSVFGEL